MLAVRHSAPSSVRTADLMHTWPRRPCVNSNGRSALLPGLMRREAQWRQDQGAGGSEARRLSCRQAHAGLWPVLLAQGESELPLTRGPGRSQALALRVAATIATGAAGLHALRRVLTLRSSILVLAFPASTCLAMQVEMSAASAVNPSLNSYDTKSWASSSVCPFLMRLVNDDRKSGAPAPLRASKACDDACESCQCRHLRRKKWGLALISGAHSRRMATGWK